MKVKRNWDTESDDQQNGNQNHDVTYNSNYTGDSLTDESKFVCLY